ncbi:acetyl-CoA carboxylase biotin carboxyl carrier protein [Eubacterium ramulus]
MEVSQLIELMNAVSEAGLTDFCYEENGVSVKIKKHPEKKIVASAPVEMIAPAAVAAPLQVSADTSVSADTDVSEVTGNTVKSPLVGTFYSASSPDAAPYVQVGDMVKKGQVLGIVEAMKLMNEIESEFDGTVKAILVKNGDLVEFDQPMFVIE